jgi:hypothetical protein
MMFAAKAIHKQARNLQVYFFLVLERSRFEHDLQRKLRVRLQKKLRGSINRKAINRQATSKNIA